MSGLAHGGGEGRGTHLRCRVVQRHKGLLDGASLREELLQFCLDASFVSMGLVQCPVDVCEICEAFDGLQVDGQSHRHLVERQITSATVGKNAMLQARLTPPLADRPAEALFSLSSVDDFCFHICRLMLGAI